MTAFLEVEALTKNFPPRRGQRKAFRAVDEVSFALAEGRTLAIVGESGSGKSTTARAVLRLIEPSSGKVTFDGIDVTALDREGLLSIRSRMQIVFQDTYASLDPRWTIGRLLEEPLRLHSNLTQGQQRQRVGEMLELVGLEAAHASRYPHEFSGGQRQRIGIARALMLRPQLVVCDEPVSALDVSVQAQVLNLMKDLQDELGLSYLFISHDLAVVRFMANDLVVMQHGKVVEAGDCKQVLSAPSDPYTRELLDAIPVPDPSAYA